MEFAVCDHRNFQHRATDSAAATRALHKFGGSSLADVDGFRRVADIIRTRCGPTDLIVVSAAGKTTNRLLEFVELCGADVFAALTALEALVDYQRGLIEGLVDASRKRQLTGALRRELTWIRAHAFHIIDNDARDRVLAHGEVWSARLLAAHLTQNGLPASWLDARTVLRAEAGVQPVIQEATSRPLVQRALKQQGQTRVVITGFMAGDAQGETVLLGRNGSDYSATMLAILADATHVTIWSDVSGVYTADPRIVPAAVLQPAMSLSELAELARMGAGLLHRRSLEPITKHGMKLALRSSFDADAPATEVLSDAADSGLEGVKSVTSLASIQFWEAIPEPGESVRTLQQRVEANLRAHAFDALVCHPTENGEALIVAFVAGAATAARNCLRDGGVEQGDVYDGGLLGLVGSGRASLLEAKQRLEGLFAERGEAARFVGPSTCSLVALVPFEELLPWVQEIHTLLRLGDPLLAPA